MKKSITFYNTDSFYSTGNIVAVQYSVENEQTTNTVLMNNFHDVLLGIIIGREIYNKDIIYLEKYNNSKTVKESLIELSDILKDNIEIVDIQRIAFNINPLPEGIIYDSYKDENQNLAMILYMKNKESKSTITQVNGFIYNLLKHIIEYRPLCVKEGDLLSEIVQKEVLDSKGNKQFEFLSKAVLDQQKLFDDNPKPIKLLLEELGINIIDFNYISV